MTWTFFSFYYAAGCNRTSFIFVPLALWFKISCGLCLYVVSALVLRVVKVPANMIFSREPSFNYSGDWRLFDPGVEVTEASLLELKPIPEPLTRSQKIVIVNQVNWIVDYIIHRGSHVVEGYFGALSDCFYFGPCNIRVNL